MKNERLLSKILAGILICSMSISSTSFAKTTSSVTKDKGTYKTGAKLPTKEELELFNKESTHIRNIKLNDTAMRRINNARKKSGLKELTTDPRYVCPDGKEFESNYSESDSLLSNSLNNKNGGIKSFLTQGLKNNNNGRTLKANYDSNSSIASDGLPNSVDNSDNSDSSKKGGYFPAIMNQEGLDSCTACATTYYQLTYEYAVANGLKASDNPPIFSPNFTYNLNNGGANNGIDALSAYRSMSRHGAATVNDPTWYKNVDINEDYLNLQFVDAAWINALKGKLDGFGSIDANDTDGSMGLSKPNDSATPVTSPVDDHLFAYKAYLVSNHVLTVSTDIEGWQRKSDNSDCAYEVVRSDKSKSNGYHQMTIVGYDNNKTMTDNNNHTFVGAFKIANSWGSDWKNGNNGFTWLAYDALNLKSMYSNDKTNPFINDPKRMYAFDILGNNQNTIYWMKVKKAYKPQLLARFRLSTSKRNQIKVNLQGFGKNQTPYIFGNDWQGSVLNYNGGPYNFLGKTDGPCGATFVFDYTDLIKKLGVTDIDNEDWYLEVTNRNLFPGSGPDEPVTIEEFELIDSDGNELARYNGPKVSVVDNGTDENSTKQLELSVQ